MAGILHAVKKGSEKIEFDFLLNPKKREKYRSERNIESMKDLLHLQQELNFAKDE